MYADTDRDGWNDTWVNKYPDAPRDTTSDSNGDGTPNFIEMMLDRDPFEKPVQMNPADPRAAEKLEKRRAATRKLNGEALAPFLNDGIRDANGIPVTRAELKVQSQEKSRALGKRLERKAAARKIRIQTYLEGPGNHLGKSDRTRLHDVVDGEPRFISALSHDQAYELSILELWPGGFTNNNLTGSGATVAMWDQGGVAAIHDQFGTARVDNVDNPGPPNEHATAVATVIIGAGDPTDTDLTDFDPGNFPFASPNTPKNNARGMAFEANVRTYNLVDDLGEMTTLASESLAGTRDIVFSNHAYGTSCGYQRFHPSNPSAQWNWHGDPNLGNGKSDYKHGFYLAMPCRDIDEIVDTHKIFLPIWAAGNEDTNFDLADSPEPEEAGKSDAVAHKVLATGATYTAQNAPKRNPDYFTEAFINADSNLIPEACSKNVLSVSNNNGASSKGPTDDLRFKPDIQSCASGGATSISAGHIGTSNYREFEGSSFSAASVTGGMALIRQRWLQLNGTTTQVLASTWKGLATATAGGVDYNINGFRSGGGTPSAENGYGQFDPLDAVFVIEEDFASRNTGTGARIMEILLEEGDVARFNIRSSKPNVDEEFRVAICWTDPPGQTLVKSLDPRDPVLVNDIDLRVLRPGQTDLEPWLLTTQSLDENNFNYRRIVRERGDNTRDNFEAVDGTLFDSGSTEYTVEITRKPHLTNNAPQQVSIIVVGDAEAVLPPFRIVSFAATDEFNPDIYGVTWQSIPGAVYQLETSADLATWVPVPVEISAIGDKTTTNINLTGMGDRQFVRVRRLD